MLLTLFCHVLSERSKTSVIFGFFFKPRNTTGAASQVPCPPEESWGDRMLCLNASRFWIKHSTNITE